MTNKQIKYLLYRTIEELILNFVFLLDFITPDFTIFSVLRKYYFLIIANIGKGTRIKKGQYISHIKCLKIGKNCFINRENIFDSAGGIIIGNDCSIGYRNQFITSSHYEKGTVSDKVEFTTYTKKITIGNNVRITSNCIILPGTIIEDNVILAAGSIAKGNLEKGFIYGGIPAKKIRETKGFLSKNI